jgi:hypothetical protein
MEQNQALITALKDPSLSLKAKGLLALLLLVDDELSAGDVVQLSRDGIDSVRSGLRELIEHGFIERELVVRAGKPPRWQTRVHNG